MQIREVLRNFLLLMFFKTSNQLQKTEPKAGPGVSSQLRLRTSASMHFQLFVPFFNL